MSVFEIEKNDLGHKIIQRFKYEIERETEKAIFVKCVVFTDQPSMNFKQIGYGKFWLPKSLSKNHEWISFNKFNELERDIQVNQFTDIERIPEEYHNLIKELLK